MIDPTRWIVVETWLRLGLRIRWAKGYEEREVPTEVWQTDIDNTGTRFLYLGEDYGETGIWVVKQPNPHAFREPDSAPELSTATMLHELAHYLQASKHARTLRNFGLTNTPAADEVEDHAMEVERGMRAVIETSARIASMALGVKR